MPDRDWYDRNVRPNWRGAARRIAKDVGPGGRIPRDAANARVGDLAFRALGKEVRQAQGVPGFSRFVEVVEDFTKGGKIPQAFAELRKVSLQVGGSDLTRVAEAAAQATIIAFSRGQVAGNVTGEMSRRFVERAFERFLFGSARPQWTGRCFSDAQQAHEWQRQFISSIGPRIDQFANRLVRHPTGYGLRAPSREARPEATSALLYETVT